jgi:DNA invertase Pin-like site-specific DNA recombinase
MVRSGRPRCHYHPDRPGGKRLLAEARQKKFTVVLVYKVDRLGRADVVSHIALHHLETLGVGLSLSHRTV